MAQTARVEIPAVFGRYEMLFRIAAGGMAEVYAARVKGAAGFEKLVALKRMLPHLNDDKRFVDMFMDEGQLAASIHSPNVVSTLDLGRASDGSLYLVMELVVGPNLSALMRAALQREGGLPIDVAIEIIAQSADGLHDAHEARTPAGVPLHIVHRDVSPQNILIGADGLVRLTDFGVARAILRRTQTSTGEFKGKLSYFSPEQCADGQIDRRSDVFSLGVVAWEVLTGRRLFHAENPLAILEKVTRMPIDPPHELREGVPEQVSRVVMRALERDRAARPATAAEFAGELRAAARATLSTSRGRIAEVVATYTGESVSKIQDRLRESIETSGSFQTDALDVDSRSGVATRSAIPTLAAGEKTPARQRKRKRRIWAAVAVAALAAAGMGIALVSLGSGSTRREDTPVRSANPAPPAAPETPPALPEPTTPEPPAIVAPVPAIAAVTEEPDEEAAPARARRRAPRRGRGVSRPQASTEQVAQPQPREEEPRRPPPESRPASTPAPRTPAGLVGLDGFERDIRGD